MPSELQWTGISVHAPMTCARDRMLHGTDVIFGYQCSIKSPLDIEVTIRSSYDSKLRQQLELP